ncbi:GntR family transcriptional regulator [Tichowtungia aerotolerans]|uniref:GntR family transcriptional regulator n=1 Tax=Tichowtungia aerotolerans TaxID=2697043 RepID=A0A6P1MA65_9BACT|nr:GntR family transcriptional regulator [Tichowtungia aerotolerans]QHI68015.1 GntR family transcriptional regulator [Tichowtungia aerotolerans]
MQKFERLAATIEKQIEKGDFSLSGLPSERILAEKLGANRLTIRKALSLLEQKKMISRADNGRYEITPQTVGSSQNVRVAILTPPAFSSGNIRIWYEELFRCAEQHSVLFRPFLFVHWNDTSISDVFSNFDGVFIIPSEEKIPEETLLQFLAKDGLVFLNTNMSHHQILSINLYPAIFVRQLLDQLSQMGHQNIACLHLQSDISDVLNNRISQWEYWSTLNENTAPFIKANINPFNEGYTFLDEQIQKGALKNITAVFCTTVHAAIALIRACKNNGLDPEKDISICTIDDEGIGMHSTPSITCFEKPDIQKILRPVFNWIKAGGNLDTWKGPLLIEPANLKVYPGETLHPPVNK